ncbi:hypothetical protein pb186bvf_000143 [Paramecium bursaria]
MYGCFINSKKSYQDQHYGMLICSSCSKRFRFIQLITSEIIEEIIIKNQSNNYVL